MISSVRPAHERSNADQKRPENGSASSGGFGAVAGAALGSGAGVGVTEPLTDGRGRPLTGVCERTGLLDGAADGSGARALTGRMGTIRGGVAITGACAASVERALATPSFGCTAVGDDAGVRTLPSSAAAAM